MRRLMRFLAAAALVLAAPALAQDKKVEVQWFGHATFKITTPGGKVIVVDPWLTTNPSTPQEYKNPESLGKVDLILVTHAHGDHFANAPELAKKHNARIFTSVGLADNAVALGILPRELAPRFNKSGVQEPWGPSGVKLIATHAEHSSELTWKNPATAKDEIHVGGEPLGFIIEMENGFKIYLTGDTAAFGDMKFIAEYHKPDLVLICIGGHFTMGPAEAAHATREWIKPKYAIPMHYGANPLTKGTAEEYIKALGNAPVKVFPIKPGEKVSF